MLQIGAGVSLGPKPYIVKLASVNRTSHNLKIREEECTLVSQCGSRHTVANLTVFHQTVGLSVRLRSVN